MFFHAFQNEGFSFWKGRAGSHLLEKFSVSFAFEFWIRSESLSLPDGPARVTASSMASKGIDDLCALACRIVKGKYLCLPYSHEIFNRVTCLVISCLKFCRNTAFRCAEILWDDLVKVVKGNGTESSH